MRRVHVDEDDVTRMSLFEKAKILRKQNRILIWYQLIALGVFVAIKLIVSQYLVNVNHHWISGELSELELDVWLSIVGMLVGIGYVFIVKHTQRYQWWNERPQTMNVVSFLKILTVMGGLHFITTVVLTVIEYLCNTFGYSIYVDLIIFDEVLFSIPLMLGGIIIAPLGEELLFRDVFINPIIRFGKVFAIVASSIMFSLIHGNIPQSVNAFFIGIVLGYVAIEYSVGWAMIYHFINNAILSYAFTYLISRYRVEQRQSISFYFELTLFFIGLYFVLKHSHDIKMYIRDNKTHQGSYLYMFVSISGMLLILMGILSMVLLVGKR